jgi:O-antigen ligase
MKWVALLMFTALVPVLTAWLRENPRLAPRIWAVMGFLPFVMGSWHLIVAPISWAMWPGYVKGVEVSLLDAIALAVYLSRPRVRVRSPFMIALSAYILAVLLSAAFASVPDAAVFYAWQLARVFLVFAAVARVCADERGPSALIFGMIIGLCLQAGYSIEGRLSGTLQASGSMGHQNLLGMISHFAVFPALAMLLADRKHRMSVFGVAAGAIVVILGASRATMGLAAIGFVALLLLSIIRKPTSRKTMIVALGLLGLVAATPLALSSLAKRFEAAPISGNYDERVAFERAAKMVIADHPMGIGANQYVVVANTQGYSDRAGVVWNFGSRAANVHNTYLLVTAETGYLGLAAFLSVLLNPIVTAFRGAGRNRKDGRGDLMLGLGVSLAIVAIHCFYEWVFVNEAVQYLFAIDVGVIVGLARQAAVQKRRIPRPLPAPPEGGPLGAHETA